MWESPLSLIASLLSPIHLFLSFHSTQIPFSLCSLSPQILFSFFFPSLSLLSSCLTLSVCLFSEERLCEQVEACQKRVNHRYECNNILDFFSRWLPKEKIKADVRSFIMDLSLAATSCVMVEMLYLSQKTVIFEN